LDRGQESEEDVADGDGAEKDAVANIAKYIENKISNYKTWSALPFKDNAQVFSDPLLWWKQRQFFLPILSCPARKYLCIPATKAPSERTFSTVISSFEQIQKLDQPRTCW
jgi:hypothetical protein